MTTKNNITGRKSFFSIKAKIALLCTCSILIAISVTFVYMVKVSKDAVTESTEITMKNLADSYSSNLSDAVRQISQSANFMMSSSAISSFVDSDGTESEEEVKELASMFLSTNTSYEDISIVDENGIVLYSSNSELIGADLSGETYFKNMVSSGLATQGNVSHSESSGDACISFAIPLRTDMQIIRMDAAEDASLPASDTTSTENTFTSDDSTMAPTATGATGPVLWNNSQDLPVEEFTGAIVTSVNVSEFSTILSEINVVNYETGFAFILDSTGNYIYHPDESMIGTASDIDEINDIIGQIQAGTTPETNIITYMYNNVHKYAGFSIDPDNQWILFIAVDRAEVMDSLNGVASNTFVIALVLVIVLSLVAYLVTGTITNSIKKITHLINKTAEFDFAEDNSFHLLSLRKDETGEMSRAIDKMRDSLKKMVLHINEVSGKITESSTNLNGISLTVNEHASDNSATTQELSASMEETAATTEQIYTAIEQISNNSKDITDKVSLGAKLSTDIINRAIDLKTSTTKATQKTQKIYEEVKIKTDAALEQAKAVDKINFLTNSIKDIASQTSLLALNASIEAARAGDAGRGFSVVASEIGILANQSAKTVSHITETVDEVYEAVENMSKSLEQTLNFLGSNVLADYNAFVSNSEKYNTDAGNMNVTMENILTQIDMLNTNVLGISDSISEINMMVSEASKGVSDVAEKNTDIASLTAETQNMAMENTDYANGLKEIVDQFKL